MFRLHSGLCRHSWSPSSSSSTSTGLLRSLCRRRQQRHGSCCRCQRCQPETVSWTPPDDRPTVPFPLPELTARACCRHIPQVIIDVIYIGIIIAFYLHFQSCFIGVAVNTRKIDQTCTGRVDVGPVSITCQRLDGPCWWLMETGLYPHPGPSKQPLIVQSRLHDSRRPHAVNLKWRHAH